MSFIQREQDRVAAALRQPLSEVTYGRLYAVQAALAWAQEPSGFLSPFELVMSGDPTANSALDVSLELLHA